jgi:hypothetical protein
VKYPLLDLPANIDKDMFRLYRIPRKGEFFVIFIDTAGEGSDFNAGQFMSKTRIDVPLVLHYEGSITDVTPKLLPVGKYLREKTGIRPVIAYETNNGGGYELERLNRLNKDGDFIIYCQYKLDTEGKLERTDKMGWNTNSATRPAMLTGVEDLVNNGLATLYDIPTINELFSFVKKMKPGGWRAEAEEGAHDDLVMSLAGVWQLYQTENAILDDYVDDEITATGWVKNAMGIR